MNERFLRNIFRIGEEDLLRDEIKAYMKKNPEKPKNVMKIIDELLDLSEEVPTRDAEALREFAAHQCQIVLENLVAEGELKQLSIDGKLNNCEYLLQRSDKYVYIDD